MSIPYYVVKKGITPGIYRTWNDCQEQIKGYPDAVYKKFDNMQEAYKFQSFGDINDSHPQIKKEKEGFKEKLKNKQKQQIATIEQFLVKNNIDDDIVELDKKTDIVDTKKNNYIFCDGSAIHSNYKSIRCGYGVFIIKSYNEISYHSNELISTGTNNLAELNAILYGINIIETLKINLTENVIFVTDSKYAINCILVWSDNWKTNNWMTSKKTPVENSDLIKKIIQKYEELIEKGYNIEFKHINSHQTKPSDINSTEYLLWYGNEMADQLARIGKIEKNYSNPFNFTL
jgi:ribonuclease HI